MNFKTNIFFLLLFSVILFPQVQTPCVSVAKKQYASMLAGAVGDALGRVTEFVCPLDKIFARYPQGVTSSDNFFAG